MILFSFALLAVGLICALAGARLAKTLMPLFGLFAGTMVGYIGTQGVFGTGVLSSTMAIFVAIVVGVLMALLSYVFFDLAITLLMGFVVANALSFLGIALGLRENGFLVLMLWVAGLILGLRYAAKNPTTEAFLVYLTSFAGVAMIFASVLLISGNIELTEIYNNGVIATVLKQTSQSLVWFVAWFGGALVASQVQVSSLINELNLNRIKK